MTSQSKQEFGKASGVDHVTAIRTVFVLEQKYVARKIIAPGLDETCQGAIIRTEYPLARLFRLLIGFICRDRAFRVLDG